LKEFFSVRKVIIIGCFAVFVPLAIAVWQLGACMLANVELRDDMQDMSSQLGSRIGLTPAASDEDLRQAIFRHAQKYGIDLDSNQITVRRSGPEEKDLYLAVDYTRLVRVPGMTFTLHFTPHAEKNK
jgi:hypothetical protein